MERRAFKDVAELRERLESGTAAVHMTGGEPTEFESDAMAVEDCSGCCDSPESIQSCSATAAGNEPTEEQVRKRAYEIFQARNGVAGDPVADWLLAEQELRARLSLQMT